MMRAQPKDDLSTKERARGPLHGSRARTPESFAPLPLRYAWEPLAWTKELDRSFAQMRRDMDALVFPLWNAGLARSAARALEVALPRADLQDEGEAFVACVDVPGFSPEELEVEATPQRLELFASSDRGRPSAARGEEFPAGDRSYREIRRAFDFPEAVRPEEVSAELANGVLTVRAPKERPTAAPQRVRVKVA